VRKALSLLAGLAVVCLLATPASPQSQATTGEIRGTVADTTGAVVPGATVVLTDASRGISRTVVTGSDGSFVAPLLPPGTYEMTATLTGFQPARHKGIHVTVGSQVSVNMAMKVGSLEEAITVEGGATAVETTASVRTSTLDETAISSLPINGRRFQDFVTLTPTVQVDPQRGQLSLAGQRGINANVSIDGADHNQPFFGGIRGGERSNNAFTVPQEAIQEFQVVASGYTAEFGRSTGGVVNAVTKSGTNSMRGSAFYLNRNRDWADDNAFGQAAAPTQQQFGGSIGGPIQKDKAYFFLAYEQQKFTNTREVLFGSLAGFTPIAATQEAYNFYKSLETPFEATNDAWTILGRIDYQLGQNHRFNVRYTHSNNEALNSNATGNALDPATISALSNNGTEKNSTNVVVGQLTSVLKPSLLLEARAQYAREERPREANALAANVTNGVGRYGTVNFLPTTQFDWTAGANVNLTWIKNKHSFKIGADYRHTFVDQTFGFNQFGVFNMSGATAAVLEIMGVGGPTANRFDSTTVTYDRQMGNLLVDFASDEVAFFAQDSWKVTPALTLNYGLRWEGGLNPTPVANNEFLLSRVRNFASPVEGRGVDPTQIPDQLDQWGPRVGFAWDPNKDGRTVVRGYTGLYFARTPALVYAGPMNNYRTPAGDLSLRLPFTVPAGNPNNTVYKQLLLIGVDLNRFQLGELPILTQEQMLAIASALGLTPNPAVGSGPISVDPEFKNPRAFQVGLGAQREVARGITLGLEGVYVKTDRLERNRELNLAPPVIRATDPAQRPFFNRPATPRPIGDLGALQVRESTAESKYQALTFSGRVQKKWGNINVYYVLSKSESDDDNERDAGGPNYQNTYNIADEWGLARLDRTHQFNGYMIYFLPAGFELTTGFRFLSGRPITAAMGADSNGDQQNSTGNNFALDRPFSAPGVSFPRNTFRNTAFKEVNLRVQWKWNIGATQSLIFSAEAFNIFNWENIELAGTTVQNYCSAPVPLDCGFGAPTNPNFLQLTDQNPASTRRGQLLLTNNPGAPRQLQLGVRFQF
jgi:Carboxypeptidase regulatory-like domain